MKAFMRSYNYSFENDCTELYLIQSIEHSFKFFYNNFVLYLVKHSHDVFDFLGCIYRFNAILKRYEKFSAKSGTKQENKEIHHVLFFLFYATGKILK